MVIRLGVETVLAAVAVGILVQSRGRFDGRSPLTTRGVWMYAVALCTILVALGVAALLGMVLT